MEKHIIDRRVDQLEGEGTIFKYGINVGIDLSIKELEDSYDAIVLSGGSEHPRDLPVEGEILMEYILQWNSYLNKTKGYRMKEFQQIQKKSWQPTKM